MILNGKKFGPTCMTKCILTWFKVVDDNKLNYISAYKLNRMYNSINNCRQCENPEEGPAHIILYCEVSNLVFGYFDNVLQQIFPLSISIQEKAFGLIIQNRTIERKKRLRNDVLSCIKHIIFKRRAREIRGI